MSIICDRMTPRFANRHGISESVTKDSPISFKDVPAL
jgi:hypothetical protein